MLPASSNVLLGGLYAVAIITRSICSSYYYWLPVCLNFYCEKFASFGIHYFFNDKNFLCYYYRTTVAIIPVSSITCVRWVCGLIYSMCTMGVCGLIYNMCTMGVCGLIYNMCTMGVCGLIYNMCTMGVCGLIYNMCTMGVCGLIYNMCAMGVCGLIYNMCTMRVWSHL